MLITHPRICLCAQLRIGPERHLNRTHTLALATVLGTALSILLAVRVNTSYARWWEASGLWAQISALSRNLARVVIAVGESKKAAGAPLGPVSAFQRSMIEGQIACFTHLYVAVFPFAIIGSLLDYRWLVMPATLVLAYAFRMVERIGAVVESPFENTVQDVPLTAICVTLERDLLEQLGDPNRPPAPAPVAGYLQ